MVQVGNLYSASQLVNFCNKGDGQLLLSGDTTSCTELYFQNVSRPDYFGTCDAGYTWKEAWALKLGALVRLIDWES